MRLIAKPVSPMLAGGRANIAKRLPLEFGTNFVKVPAWPPGRLSVFIAEHAIMKRLIEIPITPITVSF